jgi:predicted transport protein
MLSERLFEDILVKYTELIENKLTFIGRQVTYFGKRIDILFEDRFKEKLIVELKIGNLQRNALSQVMEYEGYILSEKDPSARVMIIANRIPLNLKKAMDHHGIEYKEITIKHLMEFLEKRDEVLLNSIMVQKQDKPQIIPFQRTQTKKAKTVDEHLRDSSKEINGLFEEFNNKVLGLSSKIYRYTTWQNILYKTSVIIIELNVQRQRLRLLIRTIDGNINDPKNLAQKVPKSHGWGNLTHIVYIDPKELNIRFTMDDIMNLVIQSFKST